MKMEELTGEAKSFWFDFFKNNPGESLIDTYDIQVGPAGAYSCTDELISLYRSGKKYAGSFLAKEYEDSGERIPAVGDYWIVLDSKKKPAILLKTESIEFYQFDDISKRIACAEGEGNLTIEFWKHNHANFWRSSLKKWGISDINSAKVYTEFFILLYDSKSIL